VESGQNSRDKPLMELWKVKAFLRRVFRAVDWKSWRTWLWITWIAVGVAFFDPDFALLYCILTGFFLVLTNLGRRKAGELSAYPVFNPGMKPLPGTTSAREIDASLRAGGGLGAAHSIDFPDSDESETENTLKPIEKQGRNELCICGSGLKFKKCCGSPAAIKKQTLAGKTLRETE